MTTKFLFVLTLVLNLVAPSSAVEAGDLSQMLPALKQGGHVIIFRHVATDESQKDVYPFKFEDMAAQRQLSDKGREVAREIGAALKDSQIGVADVYTSKLNRAIETGKLIGGRDSVTPLADLTDSGAGNPSAMSRPGGGGNAALGAALRKLANTAPPPEKNTIIVTHKTNIADAFGKDWNDVKEGEASVFKPARSGEAVLIGRVQASDWRLLQSR